MTKKPAPKAKPKASSKGTKTLAKSESIESPPRESTEAIGADVPGELRQLAELRRQVPPLSMRHSEKLLAHHSPEVCRARGGSTRAVDIFRMGMSWARILGSPAGLGTVSPLLSRWFLDCLTSLGQHLAGRSTAPNPSDEASYDDVAQKADKLFARSKRRLVDAVGSNATHRAALDEALKSEGALDTRIATFRQVGALVKGWLDSEGGPPLEVYGITADTAKALATAADELAAAIARRPTAQQINRDSPVVNESEGRVLLAMRPIWDELAEAREDGTTSLQLTVSPAILRGLDLAKRKRKRIDDGEPES